MKNLLITIISILILVSFGSCKKAESAKMAIPGEYTVFNAGSNSQTQVVVGVDSVDINSTCYARLIINGIDSTCIIPNIGYGNYEALLNIPIFNISYARIYIASNKYNYQLTGQIIVK